MGAAFSFSECASTIMASMSIRISDPSAPGALAGQRPGALAGGSAGLADRPQCPRCQAASYVNQAAADVTC